METIEIRHNPDEHRFEARVEGFLCRADYRLDGNVLALVHTEVPPLLEGRGIAAQLVAAAFAHAREHGLAVRPVCSYVRAWVRRHPEVQALVA